MSSRATGDERTLLHFSESTLEIFCQHVQARENDYEAGGLLLGSVHGNHRLTEQATAPTEWDRRFRYLFERMPFGHKDFLWRDGRRVRESSAIWANGTHIRKTILILLDSTDWNGTAYQRSVWTSGQCLLSLSGEGRYMPSWCRYRAEVRYLSLWSSGQ